MEHGGTVAKVAAAMIVACGCGIALGLGFVAAKKKSKVAKSSGFAAYTQVFMTRWSNKLDGPTPRKSDGKPQPRPTFTTVAGQHSITIEPGLGGKYLPFCTPDCCFETPPCRPRLVAPPTRPPFL